MQNESKKKSHHKAKPPKVPVTSGLKMGKCPEYLGTYGTEAWERAVEALRALNRLDGIDFRVIESFAAAYEEYRFARDKIFKNGKPDYKFITYTTDGEARQIKRPEVDVMTEAWKRMTGLMPQLFLTPASRTKLAVEGEVGEAKDPFAEFLLGRS